MEHSDPTYRPARFCVVSYGIVRGRDSLKSLPKFIIRFLKKFAAELGRVPHGILLSSKVLLGAVSNSEAANFSKDCKSIIVS